MRFLIAILFIALDIIYIPSSHVVQVGRVAPLLYSPKNIIVPPSNARDSLDTHKTLLATMTQVQSERMT
eukprot:scaffold8893_cov48-Attheya_sp.AAC.1